MENKSENLIKHILENKITLTEFVLKEWLKEYALEIASDAYNEGFTYGIGSHKDFIQTGMNKFEYSQKLNEEL